MCLHYPGKGTSGCTAELERGTGKCSQNGMGLLCFALSWESHFRLHCGTEKRHYEVLPEWSGTNAFFSCTAELERGTGKCSQNGLGLMLCAAFRKSHFQLHCGTGKRNWEMLPEWSGTKVLAPFAKMHFQLHCRTAKRNWEVLPEWSGD